MSFGGTGGRDCRTGFVTCLECNKHEVTGFELLCGSQESDTPGRDAWKCPACSNLSYTDSMLKNMRFVEIAANGGPRGDDTDDGEEPSTDGLREDEVELEVPKQGISRVALDTPKSGGSNSSALENPVVFEGRRVNAILNDLVECEDQVSAIRHRLVRLIRDVQDFYFENSKFLDTWPTP
ncbi:hypothetical protein N7519_008678 [Penicillium mononematosum]|uniref:uncharacterized protein n=1 Tax=Penicillium mononematosum TaxID=268346 RepID=UPI002549104E|nr:uncharacterized protein N7519_008678 [Penicillium mononematosum]KAJ6178217.1 hypothetical protein N7519_008678 [Penicillium mononematosum]